MSFLSSRDDYVREVLPRRRDLLKQAILAHQSAVVVFYGVSYRRHWRDVAGATFLPTGRDSFLARNGDRPYLLVAHPNARGLDANYFADQGKLLRQWWRPA